MRESWDILVVAVVVMLVVTVNVEGSVIIDDPGQLMGANNHVIRYVSMAIGDNLDERIGGVDYVVDKGDGEYYIFFGKNVTGGVEFGGYVETDNALSSSGVSGYEGFCDGLVYISIFPEGSSPDYALAIYDDNGGQFALADGGTLSFDANVEAWFMGDIEYDGVVGGLTNLDFSGTGDVVFEHTVLLPEPTTMTLLALGGVTIFMRRRRK
jgi:hypothetical protein